MRYILLFCIFFSITFVSLYTWDFFSHRSSQAIFIPQNTEKKYEKVVLPTKTGVNLTPTISPTLSAFPSLPVTPISTPATADPTPTFFSLPISSEPTPTVMAQEEIILEVKNALNNSYVLQKELNLTRSSFTFLIKTQKSLPHFLEGIPFFELYNSKGELILIIGIEDIVGSGRIAMEYAHSFAWATDIPDDEYFYWKLGESHTLEITLRQGEAPILVLDKKNFSFFISAEDQRTPSVINIKKGDMVLIGNDKIMVEHFIWTGK